MGAPFQNQETWKLESTICKGTMEFAKSKTSNRKVFTRSGGAWWFVEGGCCGWFHPQETNHSCSRLWFQFLLVISVMISCGWFHPQKTQPQLWLVFGFGFWWVVSNHTKPTTVVGGSGFDFLLVVPTHTKPTTVVGDFCGWFWFCLLWLISDHKLASD